MDGFFTPRISTCQAPQKWIDFEGFGAGRKREAFPEIKPMNSPINIQQNQCPLKGNGTGKVNFRRFKVNSRVDFKKGSSLSPVNRNSNGPPAKEPPFDSSKLKKVKEVTQESELKIQHLYNQFLEKKENEADRVRLCFEMLNSVFVYH